MPPWCKFNWERPRSSVACIPIWRLESYVSRHCHLSRHSIVTPVGRGSKIKQRPLRLLAINSSALHHGLDDGLVAAHRVISHLNLGLLVHLLNHLRTAVWAIVERLQRHVERSMAGGAPHAILILVIGLIHAARMP